MTQSSMDDGSWVETELQGTDFGDLRLDRRFQVLARELASRPSFPINQATTDWASAKAAYRFFENPKVGAEKILAPHYLSTELRIGKHERVLVVQDSSIIDFSRHPKTTGLGMTSTFSDGGECQGLILHTALAMTEKGLPLGLVDHQMWVRKPQKAKGHANRKIPIEKKESFKWFKGFRSAIKRTPETELIVVCDREGDIYEFFEEAMDTGVELVVRLAQNRVLYDEELDYIRILDRLGLEEKKGKITIEIKGSGQREKRQAELEIRYLPVTFSGQPRGVRTAQVKHRHDLDLYIVELRETIPPKGVEPVVWTLATTLEVKHLTQALEVAEFYKLRWSIELYFKSLKTGCNVENCRLSDGAKLINYVSFMSVVAWRILWMPFLNRNEPEMSCEAVLTPNEWRALWLKHNQRNIKAGKIKPEPPKKPPAVRDALRWIAMQGGFLGRKGDGEPGLITIWRGWLELGPAVEMYEILQGLK